MSLQLYMHPLSSYTHKALIALYENDLPFTPLRVDEPEIGAAFRVLWPVGRFPVLRDDARGAVITEATTIIEYLAVHCPGPVDLIPSDRAAAVKVRERDRFFDNYLHTPMQKFAFDARRPPEARDAYGVDEARALYRTALDVLEADMATRTWAVGETFTLADCAAAPALFYGDRFFGPFARTHPNAMAYLARLKARPSYARALREAEPFFHMLPG